MRMRCRVASSTTASKSPTILPMIRQERGLALDTYGPAALQVAPVAPGSGRFDLKEEPQVMFHRANVVYYRPEFMYGIRPKVDLLRRLCFKGYWDKWDYSIVKHDVDFMALDAPCEIQKIPPPVIRSSVVRINDKKANIADRGKLRMTGVFTAVKAALAHVALRPNTTFWNDEYIDEMIKLNPGLEHVLLEPSIADDFTSVIAKRPSHPMVKKALASDPHLYFSVPAYYTSSGIRVDGQRTDVAKMNSPANIQECDRSRLQWMVDNLTIVAVAQRWTGKPVYKESARSWVLSWFVNERTRMHPNLDLAQVRTREPGDVRGDFINGEVGVIEGRYFMYASDSIRYLVNN